MAKYAELEIIKGKTFSKVVRWEEPTLIYKAITAITQAAPVRLTVASHGMPDGWRCRIESVKGMTQINTAGTGANDEDWVIGTVIDANTIEINTINSLDFKAYVSGGVLKFYTPASLVGKTGRMSIKDKVDGTVVASTEVAHSPLNTITIDVDDVAKTVEIKIPASATAALVAKKRVYDLEMVEGAVVDALIYGPVSIATEITT